MPSAGTTGCPGIMSSYFPNSWGNVNLESFLLMDDLL